ncbi:hypothetical protein SLA2020_256290 [Shorea laevis]
MDVTPPPIAEDHISNPAQQEANKQAALPPIPPPALDNSFVKPKSRPSKKKAKSLGPIPKETKTTAQKPYALPPVLKKQMDPLLPRPSTQTLTANSVVVSAGQGASHTSSPMQQLDPVQMTLPSIQTSSARLTVVSQDMLKAGNPLPAPQVGQVPFLVATQVSVALPLTTSQ